MYVLAIQQLIKNVESRSRAQEAVKSAEAYCDKIFTNIMVKQYIEKAKELA